MGIFGKAALGALMMACASNAYAQTSTPQTVREGQTVRGTLDAKEVHPESEWVVDMFDIVGRKGQTVTITVTSNDFDPYIDLDKGEEHLADNDDTDEDDLDSTLVFEFPENGTYRINVTSAERDETGNYVLKVTRGGTAAARTPEPTPEPRPAPNRANRDRPDPKEIRYGQTVEARLTERSPLHTDNTPYLPYMFKGKRGDTVTIDMKSAEFDAYIVIKSLANDDELAKDDDNGGGTDARLIYTLPLDDAYEIRANAISADAVGAFTLTLAPPKTAADVARENAARVLPITMGQTVRGKLDAGDLKASDGSYFDGYRFTGRAQQTVVVQMRSNDFDAYVSLRSSSDEELAFNDDSRDEDGTDSELIFTLPADGSYVIRANTLDDGETGDYILGLSSR